MQDLLRGTDIPGHPVLAGLVRDPAYREMRDTDSRRVYSRVARHPHGEGSGPRSGGWGLAMGFQPGEWRIRKTRSSASIIAAEVIDVW